MKLIATIFFVIGLTSALAQQNKPDSTRLLQAVIIEAYETDRPLHEVPASVGILKTQDLERFNNTSLLPAVNLVPGVRMEERSPGSYRFSVRGSSLRSPFGVRNVKVYWNGLPFTDGGGNTYLNLLDFSSVGSIEIIKGPGGSLYGAGTGGVILLKSPRAEKDLFQVDAVGGTYGLQRYRLSGQVHGDRVQANVQLALHESDGYREQTALSRKAANADVRFLTSRGTITAAVLYGDLSYGTPGGLTKAEFEDDPGQARPPTGVLGAVEARAAVTNKTTFGGVTYEHDWNDSWTTTSGVYAGASFFENPTTRNYEDRDETNLGARSTTEYTQYTSEGLSNKFSFGGEYQYFKSPIAVFDNDGNGNPAALQVRDEISSNFGLLFAQGDLQLSESIFVTAGASVNFLRYDFTRIEPTPQVEQTRKFDVVFSPRLAVLKKFSDGLSLFSSYSDGFSPPSLAEVRPSTNAFSNTLDAESGNNFEIGARGRLIDDKLSYDVVVYDFALRNTIVVQRNNEGADYFINAGKTSQRGLEAFVSYNILKDGSHVSLLKVWGSYAYQHYRFKEYAPLDNDYSGNALTGVAPTIFSSGADLVLKNSLSVNATLNYVDHIPLNDANTAFSDSYLLLGVRMGYHIPLGENGRLQLFGGVDNFLDEIYSLGNDLNAFGGRYYNTAMPRNYYAGLSVGIGSGK